MTKTIDFSCKHDVLIKNKDGSLTPMDESYFEAEQVASGVWKIVTDGDYQYLIEGDEEAFAIDTGYGAGNVREKMQSLTEKPLSRVAVTHDHFDHTANLCYFDMAYMSERTKELATIPFPSFSGIEFPREYPVTILQDGDIIPLKGRELQAFLLPDHAEGSMVYLDRKGRILFVGDEFMPRGKSLNGGLTSWVRNLEKIAQYRSEFDLMLAGNGCLEGSLFDQFLECARYAQTVEGEIPAPRKGTPPWMQKDPNETRTIYTRMAPHPEDMNHPVPVRENQRAVEYAGTRIQFDITKKQL